MVFLEFPDTIQVNQVGTLFGQTVENTMYFWRTAGAWTDTDASVFLEDLATWWTAGPAMSISEDYTLVEFVARDLSEQYSWSVNLLVGENGEEALDSLPTTDAMVVTLRTNKVGRAYRGRNFVAGIAKDRVVNGLFTPTWVANFNSYYTNLLDVPTTYSAVMVVASRQLNNVPRTEGEKTIITSVYAQNVPGTQRKRRVGSGS